MAVTLWFLSEHIDRVRYAFGGVSAPTVVGDVTGQPPVLPHNTYVQLEGITEHRGLTQEIGRGLGLGRTEYWYFRLLGSKGIFIEVAPDEALYGPTTRVRVEGRVVDPSRENSYNALLAKYDELFSPKERSNVRVVQVGWVPGGERQQYLIAGVFVLILFSSNLLTLVRLVRLRRQMPGR